MNELIADTPREYVQRVISLVQDSGERLRLRDRIRAGLPAIFHDERSIAGLESFLLQALEKNSRTAPAKANATENC